MIRTFFRLPPKTLVFLITTGVLFFVLRFPSLFEPYWYGDEGIYFAIGKALHAGRILYLDIWDNKPPLLYWFYFIFSDLFSIRFASLLFGLAAVITFFFLSQAMLKKFFPASLITLLFAILLGLPTIEGNIANAENFMLFPIILGALLFWKTTEQLASGNGEDEAEHRKTSKLLLFSGTLFGIGFLFKTVAVFDFSACFLYLIFISSGKAPHVTNVIKKIFRKYLVFILGFFIPLLFVSCIFLIQGVLPQFLTTIFLRNVNYVGENNAFIIPQGLLVIKMIALISALFLLYRLRSYFDHKTLFIATWLAFSVFNLFFSQRPYIHYQLVVLPSLLLLFGIVTQVKDSTKQLLLGAICLIIVHTIYTMFPHWTANKTYQYYTNFIQYLSGQKDTLAYQTFFDGNTPRDYALAAYLSLHTKPQEAIYLWGNSAQIYYLSDTLPVGKYAVSYHVMNNQTVEETIHALSQTPPRFVIMLPGTESLPFRLPGYQYKVTIGDSIIYERLP